MPKKQAILSPEEYRQKWGVPNWRDASAYPVANDMADRAWRWEFLRRRTDYRTDWEWTQRKAATDCHKKYGLSIMVDPRSSDGFIRFNRLQTFSHGDTVDAAMAVGLDPWVSDEEHFNCLKCTLAYMRISLGWEQASRSHRDKWSTYLRVIDGRAEGATFEQIGEELRPDLVYSEAAVRANEAHEAAIAVMKSLSKDTK